MKRKIIHGIVGARPNMMKMAPLARAVCADGTFELNVVHTGQHYDENMSKVFFRELGMKAPSFNLEVGSGSHAAQTAKILERYEKILLEKERPDVVLVVGDVTSTMACTLASVQQGIPVVHVEAGLRSKDKSMPEEINRIVTDSLSALLLVSEPDGLINLAREGHDPRDIRFVGNVMIDTLMKELPLAQKASILEDLDVKSSKYVYLTLHRPSNVDNPEVLRSLLNFFSELSLDIPFVFVVHPRTKARIDAMAIIDPDSKRFKIIGPLGYRDNLKIIQHAYAVFTDSGGIQEETSVLNIPCLTLRFNTERPITVDLGSSELVGNDPKLIYNAWTKLKNGSWKKSSAIPLWDGNAAGRIVEELVRKWA